MPAGLLLAGGCTREPTQPAKGAFLSRPAQGLVVEQPGHLAARQHTPELVIHVPQRIHLKRPVTRAEAESMAWPEADMERVVVSDPAPVQGVRPLGGEAPSRGVSTPAVRQPRRGRFVSTRRRRIPSGSAAMLSSLDLAYRAAISNLLNDLPLDQPLPELAEGSEPAPSTQNIGDLAEDLMGDTNPFEDALDSLQDESSSSDSPADPPAASQDAATEPTPQNNPPQASGVPPSGPARPTVEILDEAPEPPFDFVLAGDFSLEGERRVFRAVRDEVGRFVLENAVRYTLNTGFLLFQREDLVWTGRLDADNQVDLVVAHPGEAGSGIELFTGDGGLHFLKAGHFNIEGRVRSLVGFDLEGDGSSELVFALEGLPRLVVYRSGRQGWEYSHEIALPFEPAFLSEAEEEEGRFLYAVEGALKRAVALRSGEAGRLYLDRTSLLQAVKPLEATHLDGGAQSLFLDRGGRITLLERSADGLFPYASFEAGPAAPVVIVGHYMATGGRQLLFVPSPR